MLIDKIIEVTWNVNNRKHYESLGYIWIGGRKAFEIKTSELPKNSNVYIDYSCDYCGEIVTVKYQKYTKVNREIINKDCCKKCVILKTQESTMKLHGVKNPFLLDEVKEKRKKTMIEKYGVENVGESKEFHSKANESYKLNYFNTTLKNLYEENGCKLLSDYNEYNDNKSFIRYICSCGNKSIKRVYDFRRHPKCEKCIENDSKSKLFSAVLELVKNESNCTLLSTVDDYKNSLSELKFICNCGNKFSTTFHYFKYENKRQCDKCGLDSKTGENHPNWKGGITPENVKARSNSAYSYWRESVFARDNYTCQKCNSSKGGNLQAHHVLNFSKYKDLRYDVKNGITLCENCHSPNFKGSFHSVYGTHNNTLEQLEEFLGRKLDVK